MAIDTFPFSTIMQATLMASQIEANQRTLRDAITLSPANIFPFPSPTRPVQDIENMASTNSASNSTSLAYNIALTCKRRILLELRNHLDFVDVLLASRASAQHANSKNFPRATESAFFTFAPLELDNIYEILGTVIGPPGSPYEGGIFYLHISIPESYPCAPPQCTFVPPIYHPNVTDDGHVCVDILETSDPDNWRRDRSSSGYRSRIEGWTPALTIETVLKSIGILMAEPNFKTTARNSDNKIGKHEWWGRAREETLKLNMGDEVESQIGGDEDIYGIGYGGDIWQGDNEQQLKELERGLEMALLGDQARSEGKGKEPVVMWKRVERGSSHGSIVGCEEGIIRIDTGEVCRPSDWDESIISSGQEESEEDWVLL
jgi:ubiquitin-protein ligase